ncbi:glyoxylate/hydroxypyruvate reductase A-like [Glandiceps talaboti]
MSLFKMASGTRKPVITIFSRIPGIQSLIQKRCPEIPTKVVYAGTPYGTVNTLDKKLSDKEVKELSEAEIILTEPVIVAGVLDKLSSLKWMQSTRAGVNAIFDNLDRSKPQPSYKLTKMAGVFGAYMSEYVIGQIIARERIFNQLFVDQRNREWHGRLRANYRVLSSLSIGILGVGDIGKSFAETFKFFGMTVWGLVNQYLPREKRSPHVDHYRQIDGLPELLQNCDYVCSVLPSTGETKGLLNGNVLENCKERQPVFINVGRGDVISEVSLVNAMRQEWISGAILDVFSVEPLPVESQLWNMEQVTITPHVSANHSVDETVDILLENYEKYVKGETLNHLVNWERGY